MGSIRYRPSDGTPWRRALASRVHRNAGKQRALAKSSPAADVGSGERRAPPLCPKVTVGCGVCNKYDGSRQGQARVTLGWHQYELSIKGALLLLRP